MRLYDNYNLNKDIHLHILTYLNFHDLFIYALLCRRYNILLFTNKSRIIFNYISILGYKIQKNINHVTIKKSNRVITLENNIIFDEKLISLIKD